VAGSLYKRREFSLFLSSDPHLTNSLGKISPAKLLPVDISEWLSFAEKAASRALHQPQTQNTHTLTRDQILVTRAFFFCYFRGATRREREKKEKCRLARNL